MAKFKSFCLVLLGILCCNSYAQNQYYLRTDFGFGEASINNLNILDNEEQADADLLGATFVHQPNFNKAVRSDSIFQYGIFVGKSINAAPVPAVLIGFGVLDSSSVNVNVPSLLKDFQVSTYKSKVSSEALFATLQLDFFQYSWRDVALIAFLGGGAGVSFNHSDSTLTSQASDNFGDTSIDDINNAEHNSDFSYYVNAGLELMITHCLGLAAGYQFTDLGYVKMGTFDTLGTDQFGGIVLQAEHFYIHSGFVRFTYYFPTVKLPVMTGKDAPFITRKAKKYHPESHVPELKQPDETIKSKAKQHTAAHKPKPTLKVARLSHSESQGVKKSTQAHKPKPTNKVAQFSRSEGQRVKKSKEAHKSKSVTKVTHNKKQKQKKAVHSPHSKRVEHWHFYHPPQHSN